MCGKKDVKSAFQRCARCRIPFCSPACLKEDWDDGGHRLRCRRIREDPAYREPASICSESWLTFCSDDAVARRDIEFVQVLAKQEVVRQHASLVGRHGHLTSSWRVDLRRYPHVITAAADEQLPDGIEAVSALYLTRDGIEGETKVAFRL